MLKIPHFSSLRCHSTTTLSSYSLGTSKTKSENQMTPSQSSPTPSTPPSPPTIYLTPSPLTDSSSLSSSPLSSPLSTSLTTTTSCPQIVSCFPEDIKQISLLKSDRNLVLVVKTKEYGICVLKSNTDHSYLLQEAKFLKSCQHPNIVKLYESRIVGNSMMLIFEKVEGKSLVEILSKKGTFTEMESRPIFRQVVDCLCYIHLHGWAHRDIKGDNIIYDHSKQKVTLIDFEFSHRYLFKKKQQYTVGTFLYSSPEVRTGKHHGPEIDVWSLGVTIFSCLTGSFPFSEEQLEQQNQPSDLVLKLPGRMSRECQNLLTQMLEKDVKQRISMKKVKKHVWFKFFIPTSSLSSSYQETRTRSPSSPTIITRKRNLSLSPLSRESSGS